MSIVKPDIYSYKTIEPIFPYGEALTTFGLMNRHAIDGFGVVTRGLLWEMYQIWIDTTFYAPITTTWANTETLLTTVWTAVGSSLTTAWTPTQFGIYGEYTP